MAHRSEDHEAVFWLEILRLDTFWLLGVFLSLNYHFIQTQIREVVSRGCSPDGRLDSRVENNNSLGKKPTMEVLEYTYKYVGLSRLRHDVVMRYMMVVVSCLVVPLQALECCWVHVLFCQLAALLFSVTSNDPWKPYFLWTICLFLETILFIFALSVWGLLVVRLLEAQLSYIGALINLPILPKVNEADESRSESPAPQQPPAPPNTPELTWSETSFFYPPPSTLELTSSTLPSSPKMASLHGGSSPNVASLVEAIEKLHAFSPPPRRDSGSSAFGETGSQFEVAKRNRSHGSSISGTSERSKAAPSHYSTCCSPKASLSPQQPFPEDITSGDGAGYPVDQPAPTMSLATPIPLEWWDSVFGSPTIPDMSPPTFPRLPASIISSTALNSVQRDTEYADAAEHAEDAPTESRSISVPSWSFREPVSTSTDRLSDQKTRNSSAASDPGSRGIRRHT
ncbi:hypothetical protein ACHAQI_000700 [Fusarium lateritium]